MPRPRNYGSVGERVEEPPPDLLLKRQLLNCLGSFFFYFPFFLFLTCVAADGRQRPAGPWPGARSWVAAEPQPGARPRWGLCFPATLPGGIPAHQLLALPFFSSING